MATDLIGISPRSSIGECYRINIWKWHEMWNFLSQFYGEKMPVIDLWYTNDGEVFSRDSAKSLLESLRRDFDSGKISANLSDFHANYDKMRYTKISGYRKLVEIDLERFIMFLDNSEGFRIE